MSKVLVYYCECGRKHEKDCPVLIRLRIKEQICKERDIISYVPEEVEQEIDQRVFERMNHVGKN